jgi:competence protein ComEC
MFKLTYQNSSVLFTGDAELDVETSLLTRYAGDLKADVLKVGHHGSPNSTSELFLDAVSPSRAYIEVGRNNYGHPSMSVLDRLIAAGVTVYRTDLNGTQEYSADVAAPLLAAGH